MLCTPKISVIKFNENVFEEKAFDSPEQLSDYDHKNTIVWIDIEGIQRTNWLEKLGAFYQIHPLLMENILDIKVRPKIEEFENRIFIALQMLTYDVKTSMVDIEHVSILLCKNLIITFQEGKDGDAWEGIRNKLRGGKYRKTGADFLAYNFIDAIIDKYFDVLEMLGEKIEDIENEVITRPEKTTLKKIYRLKREMMYMRRAVWPVREVVNNMGRLETDIIETNTKIYLRDIYEHTVQIIDTIELYRDTLAGMLDIYLSSISYKMNAVMKVLTIIATIFIPLTFITSIYGMNFEWMPELKWKYGYLMVWAVMLCAFGFMLYFFRKKKWF